MAISTTLKQVMVKAKVFAFLASFSQYNPFVEVIRTRKRGIHISNLKREKDLYKKKNTWSETKTK